MSKATIGTAPTNWERHQIGQVAQLEAISIRPARTQNYGYVGLENIVSDTGAIVGELDTLGSEIASNKHLFNSQHILYGKLRPYLRKVALPDFSGVCSTDIVPIRPSRKVLREYLAWFLRSAEFTDYAVRNSTGTKMPRIKPDLILAATIPLPPLPVQRAIVTILNQADAVRRKQAEAYRLGDSLLASLFHDLFFAMYSPASVERSQKLKDLLLESPRYGSSKQSDYSASGTPILRIPNVLSGKIDLDDMKYVELEESAIRKLILRDGDLLIVRTNGNPDYVGRCAVVESLDDDYVFASYLMRLRPNPELVDPIYLDAFLKTPRAREQMMGRIRTSAGNYNINSSALREIDVPLPKLRDQRKFGQMASATREIIGKLVDHDRVGTANQSSLLSLAFAGDLTVEWEATHAERIAAEVAWLARRPQLALLALVTKKQARNAAPVGITSLMKYTFLAQQEGQMLRQPANHYYEFVPYRFGPFAKEMYADLEALEGEGWLTVQHASDDDPVAPERVEISISPEKAEQVLEKISELSREERNDLGTIIAEYGGLAHNELLDLVFEKYPTYATQSRRRRQRPDQE